MKEHIGKDRMDSLKVSDIMVRDVASIRADAPVADLVKLLDYEHIGGAPVVDARGHLLGVASATDVIREAAEAAGSAQSGLAVRDIMTPATFTVRPDATLAELARFLVRGEIHRALVLEGERLVGIVTAFDIVRAIARE